jgi:RimJ/RimL family protein N-acetyltransferase
MLAETLGEVLIRPLRESDLTEADRIERLAFGTYLGLPDPMAFLGDAADIATRWQTEPEGAFAAELDGALIGTNFATLWGSVGILGPLTIHPDYWNRGYATPLIKAVVDCLVSWGDDSRPTLYLRPESKTSCPLSESRFLAALPHPVDEYVSPHAI